MALFKRNTKEHKVPLDLADPELPLEHIPTADLKNPASLGDDYNLVMLVDALTANKLRVLNTKQARLRKELDAVELELTQAKAFALTLAELRKNNG